MGEQVKGPGINKKQTCNEGAMCLSDTEKGFQTQKRRAGKVLKAHESIFHE